jgi:hypothetical protein
MEFFAGYSISILLHILQVLQKIPNESEIFGGIPSETPTELPFRQHFHE